jgi:hypothetical protein
MTFDKVKAMKNAERFLAQGKIRAAISEYKRVVEADKYAGRFTCQSI